MEANRHTVLGSAFLLYISMLKIVNIVNHKIKNKFIFYHWHLPASILKFQSEGKGVLNETVQDAFLFVHMNTNTYILYNEQLEIM